MSKKLLDRAKKVVAEANAMSDKEAYEHFKAFVQSLNDEDKKTVRDFLYGYKEVDKLLQRIWKFTT